MINIGVEGGAVLNKVRQLKNNLGFDARTEEYVDMVTAGIIDPTQLPVLRYKMRPLSLACW